MIKHIIPKIKSKKGTTIVELLVTLTLTAILMTAITFMIISGMRASARAHAINSAITVSNLILDKITGELTAARLPQEGQEGYQIWLSPETPSSWIAFNSKTNIPAVIHTTPTNPESPEHYLNITYYETENSPESQWNFEPATYMNYEIKSLNFTLEAATPGLIKIELTLQHKLTQYQHQTTAYAYPHTYDTNTNYITQRNDGHTEIPAAARDFAISPSPNDDTSADKPPTEFIVYFKDKETGSSLQEPEYYLTEKDETFTIYANYIEGYTLEGPIHLTITYTPDRPTYTFFYLPERGKETDLKRNDLPTR